MYPSDVYHQLLCTEREYMVYGPYTSSAADPVIVVTYVLCNPATVESYNRTCSF